MLLTEANYKNTHFQEARLAIYKRTNDFYIRIDVGGQSLTSPPEWSQVATTETDARIIGNHFHTELKSIFYMKRIR